MLSIQASMGISLVVSSRFAINTFILDSFPGVRLFGFSFFKRYGFIFKPGDTRPFNGALSICVKE
ncbi:uncharacterized protein Dmul_23380 [Desulfococcus multivorans]|nr:uncharacterized protein Dmul_23380 [Desulfococcus multivorans]